MGHGYISYIVDNNTQKGRDENRKYETTTNKNQKDSWTHIFPINSIKKYYICNCVLRHIPPFTIWKQVIFVCFRCHLNDLENVIPFVLIGLLYVCTKPEPSTALMHFRAFAGLRIFHTFAYLIPIPQPSRVLSFLLGAAVTVSMAVTVLRTGSF